MNLVIGGAFQGKKAYAAETFSIAREEICDGAVCGREELFAAKMVVHFHEYVRRNLEDTVFLQELPARLKEENPEVVLVINELGYGVVPVDAFDRAYRESVGRLCCVLAKEAEQVHRVTLGIGTVIKGA